MNQLRSITIPEPSSTCASCGGIENQGVLPEGRHCICWICATCGIRSDLNDPYAVTNHGHVNYCRVVPME